MEVAMFDELSSEDEKKKWLFKENVRLQELSRNLEDERKLIEIQMGMLQRQPVSYTHLTLPTIA
mgnify:CR=1 FL=1